MKKIFIVTVVIVIAIIVGIFLINIYEADTEVTKEITQVGVILNGSIDDGSWSQSHYESLEKTAADLNLAMNYRENVTTDECEALICEFADMGCKVIVANSFEFGEYMNTAAKMYPEIYFLHATGVGADKNLSTYFGRIYQIRYLSGIVAGLQTQTNEIGYVAAFPISEVNRGINAFTLGVRHVKADAKVYVTWSNSWNDDAMTAEATNKLLAAHEIDVIAMHTDSLQVLEIAEEKGVMSIGYNLDNREHYPNTYLTAAVWNWEAFYQPVFLKCLQGKFAGQHYWEGINSGMVSLAPLSDKVKPGVEEVVLKEQEKINSGTFDVFYGPIYDNDGILRVLEGECLTDNTMLNNFDWYVEGVVLE